MTFNDVYQAAPWNVKIRTIRALKGLTQEQAAELCGTSKKIFNNWELARFKPLKIFRTAISKAFEVSEDEIFGKEV